MVLRVNNEFTLLTKKVFVEDELTKMLDNLNSDLTIVTLPAVSGDYNTDSVTGCRW